MDKGMRAPELIADVMRLMYQRGLVQVRGGNASILDANGSTVYISPTRIPRHRIKASDVAVIGMDGARIKGEPSSEWRMHLAIYKSVPVARAIVHAHGRNTIALAELGLLPDVSMTTEAALLIPCIRVVDRVKPGTEELAKAVAKAVSDGCPVAILKGHGAVAYSPTSIYHALEIIEALEDLSYIQLALLRRRWDDEE